MTSYSSWHVHFGLRAAIAHDWTKGSKVRSAVVREQRSEGLQSVIMPSVAAGMNFTLLLLFQFLCALPLLLLRDVLLLGLAALAQRGNPVTECLPVDPGSCGP
jgi:hypothetical protein